MRRLFWGFVKIALLIVLLVWASRVLFPAESVSMEEELISPEKMQELELENEEKVALQEDSIERSENKEGVSFLLTKEPITEQQKRYVSYSLRAGHPDNFTGTFVAHGTEPLSVQIARTFGEPIDEWGNLALHKKTFWILAELTLQNINVDAAGSFNGGVVEIQELGILIDATNISISSFPLLSSSFIPVLSSGMDSLDVDVPIPAKKTARRMSVRSWEKVLQSGSR